MIYVEKLSSESVHMYNWQTFIDYLVPTTTITKRQMPTTIRNGWITCKYVTSEKISQYVRNKLPNMVFGKHFGTTGINIDALLSGEVNIDNLAIEMSVECLQTVPKQKLKKLFENYIVILNDFMEFGTFYGAYHPHLVDFLSSRNIKPKQIFLVAGGYQLTDYPPLNIIKIQFDYWAIVTVLLDSYYSDAVFDLTYKQKMLDQFDLEPPNLCIIPMYKPRYKRVELLSILDNLNILEKCDWSLAFNSSEKVNEFGNGVENTYSEFLSKYEFPKSLTDVEKYNTLQKPPREWFNKYKFYISAETYIGDEMDPIMGQCSSITEKTFKSFLLGTSPILLSGPGSLEHLSKMGFKQQFGYYDTTSPTEISKVIVEALSNPFYDKNLIQHNFDKITDISFLIDLFYQPLDQISNLINSIRR